MIFFHFFTSPQYSAKIEPFLINPVDLAIKPVLIWKSTINYGVIPNLLYSLNYRKDFKLSSSKSSNLRSYLALLSSGFESSGK